MLELVSTLLNGYLMRSLRLSDALDFARPLSAYGVDSLAAVEFCNFLRAELMIELTTLQVINASSLSSISETIIKNIH